MKIQVHINPPPGFEATPEIKIFAPVANPEQCVLAQRFQQSPLLVNPLSVWVAVPTERVEKIKFINTPKENPNEQVQDVDPNSSPRVG